jgi:hypothetical protein
MQRGPIRSLGSVSNIDRQCNPRLFGDGFVLVTLAMEKEWNRGCLHQTKSSGISLRCTCLALPATRWLDDPRARAVHRLIGWKHCRLSVPPGTLAHRSQTLRCVPLGSDVGCASGKNIDCAYRKARMSFACCARTEWLCSLPGRSWCCCLTVLPAPPALLPLLPSRSCADGGASVRSADGGASVGGAGGVCICFIGKSVLVVSQKT